MTITREPLYTDFDLNLTRHPLSHDLAVVTNDAAIRRCITRIIKMRRFDVPYEPSKAAFIEEFLFDPVSAATSAAIRDRLNYALNKMESRAEYDVSIANRADGLGYDIKVKYKIKATAATGVVEQFLERVR